MTGRVELSGRYYDQVGFFGDLDRKNNVLCTPGSLFISVEWGVGTGSYSN